LSEPEAPTAPLEGVVTALRPLDDGRVRVELERFASAYFVPAAGEGRDELLAALERSREHGEAVKLRWTLPDKVLSLADDSR
jgi:hypothetical protein